MNNYTEPKFNFYQLKPAIFLLEVDGNNDLAYSFLRVQEFYESVNDSIRGKSFTIDEYKSWYSSQSKDGTFSYGEDWRGFNVPSSVIKECYEVNKERTSEDVFFLSICQRAKQLAKNEGYDSYYLLGVRKNDTKTLNHEIAHGLFSTNKDYKDIMSSEVEKIPHEIINPMFIDLEKIGYGKNVHIDEAQAYLATGLRDSQKTVELEKLTLNFTNIFKKFLGDWKLPTPLVKGIL